MFACAVRTDGRADGTPLGVLAIVFRWDALAQLVVERTPLSPDERVRSRVCIADSRGRLLADSSRDFGRILNLPAWSEIQKLKRGYRMLTLDGASHCLGHACSPGYETYRSGWYSLILQDDSRCGRDEDRKLDTIRVTP